MSKIGLNLNFDLDRNGVYPQVKDVNDATDSMISEWLNTLAPPETTEQMDIFNKIFNEFHLRGGKA